MDIGRTSGPTLPCGRACAGFPSPAEGHLDAPIDLGRLLGLGRPGMRAFACAAPWACGGDGFLVIEAGATARAGDMVVAVVDGAERPGFASRAGTLRDHDGAALRCHEAYASGVARWAARSHAGMPAATPGGTMPELVRDTAATYLFRVDGWSMRDAGIHDADVLVVDRTVRPRAGHVVVASVAGARTVKRLVVDEGVARLAFENAELPAYSPPHGARVSVFGVVTWGLRDLARRRG